jgi:hypothetical protein
MQPVTGRVVAGRGAVLRRPGAGQDLLAAWRADPAAVLGAARNAGAAILIVSADFATGAAGAAVARGGFVAVIAPKFDQIFRTAVTKGGVFPLCLPIGIVTELQDMVAADPAMQLTVDIDNGEVTAGDKFSAVFETAGRAAAGPASGQAAAQQAPGAGTEVPGRGSDRPLTAAEPAHLADRIRAAQLHMASLDMPADVRINLQRRLVAVCDSMKAATADPARCARRLASLTAELDRIAAASGPGNLPDLNS